MKYYTVNGTDLFISTKTVAFWLSNNDKCWNLDDVYSMEDGKQSSLRADEKREIWLWMRDCDPEWQEPWRDYVDSDVS